jgi:hypothetical protein
MSRNRLVLGAEDIHPRAQGDDNGTESTPGQIRTVFTDSREREACLIRVTQKPR